MEGEPLRPQPKPPPREKHPPKGLARKTSLKPRRDVSSFGKGKTPPHPEKALTDGDSALIGHVKATLPTRRGIAFVGKRGKRQDTDRRTWRERIIGIHDEQCIWPIPGECSGVLEIMHAYGKGAHPEWHVADWNGFPGCSHHHRKAPKNFTSTPELTQALQRCADEMRAASENLRPQPTWEELQSIIVERIREAYRK